MDLELIKSEFNKYYENFDNSNYDINYKFNHSYRVMELSKKIASLLNLNNEDIMLATVIGLLHDIGRFKQFEMFNSYDDLNIDHADLGVEILFDKDLIENFKIDKKYYEIIRFAIKNHNKLYIENTNDDRKLLFAKIIRDADKIDILNAHAIHSKYKLKECESDISDKVKEDFYKELPIKKIDLKNGNDQIILKFSFLYDINFKESFKIIKEQRLLNNLYNKIENKNMFKVYFEYLEKYLERKIIC